MKGVFVIGDENATGIGDNQGWRSDIERLVETELYNVVYDLSVPGETSTSLKKNLEKEVERRLHDGGYLAILSIGRNDAKSVVKDEEPQVGVEQFEKNVREILQVLDSLVDKIVVVSIPPVINELVNPHEPSETYHSNERVKRYNDVLENVSPTFIHPFNDVKRYEQYLIDGVHLNTNGFNLYSDELKRIVLRFIED